MRVKLIVATKESKDDFFKNTSLGKSITLFNTPIDLLLFENNTDGLPIVYNKAIESCMNEDAILIFCHDDVTLVDYHWVTRILEALNQFDIVGIAGNKRRVPFQPAWSFIDTNFTHDDIENLSGCIGHGPSFPPNELYYWGPPMQQVKLLDGLLLAARSQTLIKSNCWFDERFDFHYYDLDFCRTAEIRNLSCGTIGLFLVHGKAEGTGDYSKPIVFENYKKYIDKWKE